MYDGTNYNGWEDGIASSPENFDKLMKPKFTKVNSIQGAISQILSKRYSGLVRPVGSGRTDAGVHAKGQTMHFSLFKEIASSLEHECDVLNQMLPADIKLYNLSVAPSPSFHATKSCVGKHYVYRFCINHLIDPLQRNYVAHFTERMDMNVFKETLSSFVGCHNFIAFCNNFNHTLRGYLVSGRTFSTNREIYDIRVVEDPNNEGYYSIHFHLRSALQRMVRNIIGTSIWVATGRLERSSIKELLSGQYRREENKAPPVPGCGLCMENSFYPDY